MSFESTFTLSRAVAPGLSGLSPGAGFGLWERHWVVHGAAPGARALFLRPPPEGRRLEPSPAPTSPRPPRPRGPHNSGNPLLSLSKPEPGAGTVRELILVPTGDSLETEPSPDRQEMTRQPSLATPLRLGVSPAVLSPPQLPPRWCPSSQARPRPLLPCPKATPAGTGVMNAWTLQLTAIRTRGRSESQGPGPQGLGEKWRKGPG